MEYLAVEPGLDGEVVVQRELGERWTFSSSACGGADLKHAVG
jgi:hypothetical protein